MKYSYEIKRIAKLKIANTNYIQLVQIVLLLIGPLSTSATRRRGGPDFSAIAAAIDNRGATHN